MTKKEIKEFNIFCRNNEEGKPLIHKITITKEGAVHLHDHPELQSEVYYHLLMVQKVKTEVDPKRSWRRQTEYQCSGCLQFYFSLINKKFDKYIEGITFKTENSEDNINYDRADNIRIEHYLEKIKAALTRRISFNREEYWSEKAFYANNVRWWKERRTRIFNDLFFSGVERFPRYYISLDMLFVPKIGESYFKTLSHTTTSNYSFNSRLAKRCSSSHTHSWSKRNIIHHDGSINLELVLTPNWWKNIRNTGMAVITSETHGKFFTLQAIPHERGFLVDGIVAASGTMKNYEIKTFYIVKNMATNEWIVKRKNKVKEKSMNA